MRSLTLRLSNTPPGSIGTIRLERAILVKLVTSHYLETLEECSGGSMELRDQLHALTDDVQVAQADSDDAEAVVNVMKAIANQDVDEALNYVDWFAPEAEATRQALAPCVVRLAEATDTSDSWELVRKVIGDAS